jgi:hypothetical protein
VDNYYKANNKVIYIKLTGVKDMSSYIVIHGHPKFKISESKLDKLREDLLEIAQAWNIDPQSSVIKFIKWFHGPTYLDIHKDLKTKENIELFGKLFLAAVKKADTEGYYDYVEEPLDPELRAYYYKVLFCYMKPYGKEPLGYKLDVDLFMNETGDKFKRATMSHRFYD